MQHVLSTHVFCNHRLTTAWLERIWNAGIPAVEIFCARQHIDLHNRQQIAELGHWFSDTEMKLHSVHATDVNFGVATWLNHYLEVWPGLPKTKPVQPLVPASGWLVVNPSYDKLYQYGLMYRSPNLVPWWSKLTPVDHAGALQLYYVPADAIRMKQPGQ